MMHQAYYIIPVRPFSLVMAMVMRAVRVVINLGSLTFDLFDVDTEIS